MHTRPRTQSNVNNMHTRTEQCVPSLAFDHETGNCAVTVQIKRFVQRLNYVSTLPVTCRLRNTQTHISLTEQSKANKGDDLTK